MGLVTVSCQETKTVSLNKSQIAVVDSLSNHWNKENRPGGAIAILKDGDVLYKNVLGYADVSLSKKSTEKTGFQLAFEKCHNDLLEEFQPQNVKAIFYGYFICSFLAFFVCLPKLLGKSLFQMEIPNKSAVTYAQAITDQG